MTLSISAGATRAEQALWADGKLWDTILTPASFKTPRNLGSTDMLYVPMNLAGQHPVAEAAPYQSNYNGGRWWVQAVEFTATGMTHFDPDGNGVANFELTSSAAVQQALIMGYITVTPTNTFFECPLLRA